ncbi:hypothetical protein [Halobacillus salinus]|uniref:DUF3953 domain-containing protein n=1 Tax=Halobacillus salinus TaxID=192814 RepID=A0A4Z0GVI4_9BACI|nr:hypothetical protein [Halobacillus salinus]TGB01243.1 hypothetical protein E4663_17360 [Halobacillus salinus]
MNKFEALFAVMLLMLAMFALVTNSGQLLPFILIGLGIVALLSGVRALKASKKSFVGYLNLLTFVVALVWGVSLLL